MSTKEGISVSKTRMNTNKSLDRITLNVENGDKFLDRMKIEYSDF